MTERPKRVSRMTREIISLEVDCPWCIAKAGEPCYDLNPKTREMVRLPPDRAHLIRTKAVES